MNIYTKDCLICAQEFKIDSPKNNIEKFCSSKCTELYKRLMPENNELDMIRVQLIRDFRDITPTPCNSPNHRLKKYPNIVKEYATTN